MPLRENPRGRAFRRKLAQLAATLVAATFSLSNASPLTTEERLAALYEQAPIALAFVPIDNASASSRMAEGTPEGALACRSGVDGSVEELVKAGEELFPSTKARHLATDYAESDAGLVRAVMMMRVGNNGDRTLIREVRARVDLGSCHVSNVAIAR